METKAVLIDNEDRISTGSVRCPVCGRFLFRIGKIRDLTEIEHKCHRCKKTIRFSINP